MTHFQNGGSAEQAVLPDTELAGDLKTGVQIGDYPGG